MYINGNQIYTLNIYGHGIGYEIHELDPDMNYIRMRAADPKIHPN